MHFQHFHCISSDCILQMLHGIASLCILTHSCKLHSGMMHLLAFIRIFNVALQCIWNKVHSCAFHASYVGCILIACCIHVHSMHKMHSCAFLVCCILYMSHFNRILVHSQLDAFSNVLHSSFDAFMCILSYSSALRKMR